MKYLTTVLVALLYSYPGALTSGEQSSTVSYIQSLQNPDGGFGSASGKESDLASTSAALRGIRVLHAKPKDLRRCSAFVQRCVARKGERGAFSAKPGGDGDVRSTAMGLMALEALGDLSPNQVKSAIGYLEESASTFEDIRIAAAAFEAIEKRPGPAERWAEMVRKMRNEDGTFGTGGSVARDTGGAVVTLLRLEVSIGKRAPIIDAMKKGQQEDGGFSRDGKDPSDLETCYRIMRAFHMLDDLPNVARLHAFIASCRNRDGGYGITPGQPSSTSATYFALTILSWMSER